jgi:hypothetical protein
MLSIFNDASAQITPTDSIKLRRSFWIELGIGGSSLGSGAIAGSTHVEFKNHLLMSFSAQAEVNRSLNFSSYPTKQVSTYNLLAGRIVNQHFGVLAISGGLGFVNYHTSTSNDLFSSAATIEKDNNSVNFPILVQENFELGRVIDLGISGYANLNTVQTTAGISVNLIFGRLVTLKKRNN